MNNPYLEDENPYLTVEPKARPYVDKRPGISGKIRDIDTSGGFGNEPFAVGGPGTPGVEPDSTPWYLRGKKTQTKINPKDIAKSVAGAVGGAIPKGKPVPRAITREEYDASKRRAKSKAIAAIDVRTLESSMAYLDAKFGDDPKYRKQRKLIKEEVRKRAYERDITEGSDDEGIAALRGFSEEQARNAAVIHMGWEAVKDKVKTPKPKYAPFPKAIHPDEALPGEDAYSRMLNLGSEALIEPGNKLISSVVKGAVPGSSLTKSEYLDFAGDTIASLLNPAAQAKFLLDFQNDPVAAVEGTVNSIANIVNADLDNRDLKWQDRVNGVITLVNTGLIGAHLSVPKAKSLYNALKKAPKNTPGLQEALTKLEKFEPKYDFRQEPGETPNLLETARKNEPPKLKVTGSDKGETISQPTATANYPKEPGIDPSKRGPGQYTEPHQPSQQLRGPREALPVGEPIDAPRAQLAVDQPNTPTVTPQVPKPANPMGLTATEVKPGPATWRGKDADTPVVLTGDFIEVNGKKYVTIEGSKTGIPLEEIIYPDEGSSTPQAVVTNPDFASPKLTPEQVSESMTRQGINPPVKPELIEGKAGTAENTTGSGENTPGVPEPAYDPLDPSHNNLTFNPFEEPTPQSPKPSDSAPMKEPPAPPDATATELRAKTRTDSEFIAELKSQVESNPDGPWDLYDEALGRMKAAGYTDIGDWVRSVADAQNKPPVSPTPQAEPPKATSVALSESEKAGMRPEDPEVQHWVDAAQRAKEKGYGTQEGARALLDEYARGGRMDAEKIMGLGARLSEINRMLESVADGTPEADALRSEAREIRKIRSTESARELAARAVLISENYTVEGYVTALEDIYGRELTPKERDGARTLAKKYREQNERASALDKELDTIASEVKDEQIKAKAQAELDRQVQESTAKKDQLAGKKEALKEERKDLWNQFFEKGAQANLGFSVEQAIVLQKILVNKIKEGAINLEQLVDWVNREITSRGGEKLSDRDVYDALTYEKKKLPPEEAQKRVTELKQIAKIINKINDAISGVYHPGATVAETSALVKALRKQLAEVVKLKGLKIEASRVKSLEAAIEKALLDLEHGPEPKATRPDTPEETVLRKRLEGLRKQIKEKHGTKDEPSLVDQIAETEKKIAEVKDQNDKQYRPVDGKPKPKDPAELKAVKDRLREEFNRQKALDEIHDLENQLRSGDFRPPKDKKQRPDKLSKDQQGPLTPEQQKQRSQEKVDAVRDRPQLEQDIIDLADKGTPDEYSLLRPAAKLVDSFFKELGSIREAVDAAQRKIMEISGVDMANSFLHKAYMAYSKDPKAARFIPEEALRARRMAAKFKAEMERALNEGEKTFGKKAGKIAVETSTALKLSNLVSRIKDIGNSLQEAIVETTVPVDKPAANFVAKMLSRFDKELEGIGWKNLSIEQRAETALALVEEIKMAMTEAVSGYSDHSLPTDTMIHKAIRLPGIIAGWGDGPFRALHQTTYAAERAAFAAKKHGYDFSETFHQVRDPYAKGPLSLDEALKMHEESVEYANHMMLTNFNPVDMIKGSASSLIDKRVPPMLRPAMKGALDFSTQFAKVMLNVSRVKAQYTIPEYALIDGLITALTPSWKGQSTPRAVRLRMGMKALKRGGVGAVAQLFGYWAYERSKDADKTPEEELKLFGQQVGPEIVRVLNREGEPTGTLYQDEGFLAQTGSLMSAYMLGWRKAQIDKFPTKEEGEDQPGALTENQKEKLKDQLIYSFLTDNPLFTNVTRYMKASEGRFKLADAIDAAVSYYWPGGLSEWQRQQDLNEGTYGRHTAKSDPAKSTWENILDQAGDSYKKRIPFKGQELPPKGVLERNRG